MDKFAFLETELNRCKEHHLYRETKAFSSPQSRWVTQDGKRLLMLSSNSYLDLCNAPEIQTAVQQAALHYGTGSGGARLTTGTFDLNDRLEARLAEFKHCEAALVFNTGYMTNLGVLSAICNRDWVIFSDALNHASIIDGCRLSRAQIVIYRHNDMADLEAKLQQYHPEHGLIVSDGVFSMDGDLVNLPRLIQLADQYGVLSMIDDAHATGVVGTTGRGTAEHFQLEKGADITVGTLSKAFGSEGGFVCGSRLLIDYLRNKARSFIFSTALSPVTTAASLAAVELLQRDCSRTLALQENIRFFCQCLTDYGIPTQSESAIIPILIGSEEKALRAAEQLRGEGYFVSAIRYPTVARNTARLRITLMATHQKKELADAAAAIAAALGRKELAL